MGKEECRTVGLHDCVFLLLGKGANMQNGASLAHCCQLSWLYVRPVILDVFLVASNPWGMCG